MLTATALDPPARVETRVVGDRKAVVALSGVVDAEAHDALEGALASVLASDLDELVVDLSRTVMVDSVTLGTLVYAAKRVSGNGGTILFSGANPAVHRAFEITGLSRVFAVDRAR
jgi:anti-anti-sigma factor